LPHRELGLDGTFYDPPIATLAVMIGWRMDMFDGKKSVCLFMRLSVVTEQKITKLTTLLLGHPNAIRVFQKALGVF
jgi:hypothetical protein